LRCRNLPGLKGMTLGVGMIAALVLARPGAARADTQSAGWSDRALSTG
jgi:hypothetical protein